MRIDKIVFMSAQKAALLFIDTKMTWADISFSKFD